MIKSVEYSELTPEQRLRALWHAFCDADPVEPEFADEMETAGFIELRAVTKADLESSFAHERGIEKGGSIWVLTPAGRAALQESAQ